MVKSSRLQQCVQKSKCVSKMTGGTQPARLSAALQGAAPRSASVTENVSLLRAMYRQAREELARPQSAPTSRPSFRRCADAVRRSSRGVVCQQTVVKLLQECVETNRVNKLPLEGETEDETEDEVGDAAKDNIADRKIRMALLSIEIPKDFQDVGSAVRSLQMITTLCKDQKLALAQLQKTCAMLLEKSKELSAGLESTRSYSDYARRLQDEIRNVVDVLRANATSHRSGQALFLGDVPHPLASAGVDVLSSARISEVQCWPMKDAEHASGVDAKQCAAEVDYHNSESSCISTRCPSPVARAEPSGVRRPSFLSVARTSSLRSDTDSEEKADENSTCDDGNFQTDVDTESDADGESEAVEHDSGKRFSPCPPSNSSPSPSMNPRLKHARHFDMGQSCGACDSHNEMPPCTTMECLPPVVAPGKLRPSPFPRQSSTKRRGLDALPSLSPASCRPSGDFAAYCAKLQEAKIHSAIPRGSPDLHAVRPPSCHLAVLVGRASADPRQHRTSVGKASSDPRQHRTSDGGRTGQRTPARHCTD